MFLTFGRFIKSNMRRVKVIKYSTIHKHAECSILTQILHNLITGPNMLIDKFSPNGTNTKIGLISAEQAFTSMRIQLSACTDVDSCKMAFNAQSSIQDATPPAFDRYF